MAVSLGRKTVMMRTADGFIISSLCLLHINMALERAAWLKSSGNDV